MKDPSASAHGFINEPHIDWTLEANRKNMEEALLAVKSNFGKTYPIIINGRGFASSATLESFDPAREGILLGTTYSANDDLIFRAAEAALNSWYHWKKLDPQKRSEIILKTADIVSRKKFELASWLVYEISKPWDEAMGEIEEAVDFLRFYALLAEEYDKKTERQPWTRSEKNYTKYSPRGTTAAISSWNFPFSLLVEKIASSLMAGCPVLVKSAEQSPITGWLAVRCFLEAGVLPGMIAYLPGGAASGKAIISLDSITQITFTGSKEVGLLIAKAAAESSKFGFKRVDLETGGNNAMIICQSADLDKALLDVMHSKFSFNGQKCSALQRLILVGDKKDKWISDFIERISIESLEIGHPENPEITITALINKDAKNVFSQKIQKFKKTDSMLIYKERNDAFKGGAFVNPIIFYNIPDRLMTNEVLNEEIFGPALFVIYMPNIETAVKYVNAGEFGLTAGIHSELEEDINYFALNIRAGNIYIRRAMVGAKVDRQPFGGIKFSGMGNKVGTADRLKFYLDEVLVSKNLLSHGLLTQ